VVGRTIVLRHFEGLLSSAITPVRRLTEARIVQGFIAGVSKRVKRVQIE
jgi:hypothetical protein